MWALLSVTTVILVSACQAQSARKESLTQSERSSQDFFSQSSSELRRQSSAMASSKRRSLGKNSDVYMARRKNTDMAKRPNIILMLTDDQDKDLGSLEFMPKLRRFVREKGTEFDSGFSTTPMCCPSRSSLLTGLYVHNHKVFTNNDNCSSTFWVDNHEDKTFGRYLQDSGYNTAYFGKYLNKYNGDRIPRGWQEWQGLIRNSRFYNYSLNVNGVKHQHGDNYETDYLPDVITNRTISFLRQQQNSNAPFMAFLSYPGPHGPEDSAPQYSNLFFNVTTHKTPAYDFAPNPDKQWILRHTDKMADIHKSFTDMLMTKRLQTLQSVDDAVERVHNELERLGQLDNTYIFYTSDHGYHLGQYGLVKGKAFPFDVDTKVPFLVRGPGVSRQIVRSEPVALIDLAPTFLDIAGLEKPPHMDGESLLPLLEQTDSKNSKPWRDTILIERGKLSFERYAKITNQKVVNEVNPQNVDETHILKKDRFTKQERLQLECQKPRYQAPCQVHQKWWCKEKSDGTKKMARCRTGLERFRGERSARNNCHCQPGEIFGWKYAKLGEDERKMQRKFLKKHIMGEPGSLKKMKPRFLMTLPMMGQMGATRRVRSVSNNEPDMNGDSVVDTVLSDMAHEEIEEVDFLMEDISEEIQDLHALKNVSADAMLVGNTSLELDSCRMDNGQHVRCSNEVMTDKIAWKSSRSHIRQQIQRLRAQLNELKQIRKYLRMKRPEIGNVTLTDVGKKEKKKEILGKSLGKKKQMDRRFLSTKLGAYSLQPTYDTPDDAEICLCTNKQKNIMKERIKEERARMREERKLERLARKERRKARQEKKKNQSRGRMEHCVQDIKMNCFSHDNDHWKTAPFWTQGPFCACTNSNNNTYWCARTVNATHNYLYCEFVTGMVMYFDMRVDPHQLRNVLHTLTVEEINYMHSQVIQLREYSAETEYLKEERRLRKLELAKRKLNIQKKADKRRKEKTRKDRRKAKRRLLPAGENHEEFPLWQAARYTRRRRINRKNVQRG